MTSTSKRLWVSLLIVPLMAGLISLGLRLPNLTGFTSSKPKPRPRAIVQNQINKCKEDFQQQDLLALTAIHSLPTIVHSLQSNIPSIGTVFVLQSFVVPKPSRAPPANFISA